MFIVLNVCFCACIQKLGARWRDGLRTRKAAFRFREASLLGQEPRHVDLPAHLLRRRFDRPLEVLFNGVIVFLLLGQLGLGPLPFRRVQGSHAPGDGRGLLNAPAQEARRLQVVFE